MGTISMAARGTAASASSPPCRESQSPARCTGWRQTGRPGLGTQAQVQQLVLKLEEMIVNAYAFNLRPRLLDKE